MLYFPWKMVVVSPTSNLGCEAGCGLTVSWSDRGRIMLGSWSDRPRIVNDVFAKSLYLCILDMSFFGARAVEGDICCSAHCK